MNTIEWVFFIVLVVDTILTGVATVYSIKGCQEVSKRHKEMLKK